MAGLISLPSRVLPAHKVHRARLAPKVLRATKVIQDRKAQQEKRAYSGVFGFSAQDYSLQESMGPIQDHEAEKLLPTDRAIAMARRMLYDAAVALDQGIEPPALDAKEQRVRPAGVLLPKDADPLAWAKAHLANGLDEPVFSI